jgi:hypothetical protein
MSRDVRVFLSTLSEARLSDSLNTLGVLSVSADARRRRRQFRQLRKLFESAFSDSDAMIQVNLKGTKRATAKGVGSWYGVTALFVIALLVWVQVTLPGLSEWFATAMHRCGLK